MHSDPSGECLDDWLPTWDEIKPVIEPAWDGLIDWVKRAIHEGNNAAKEVGIDTAGIGAFLLCMYESEPGVYHTYPFCWQWLGGYNDFYDYIFDTFTSMLTDQFTFTYNDHTYTIWMWKGDYINLGPGAEIGLYFGSGEQVYGTIWDPMNMSVSLYYNGNKIISHSQNTWWANGFNSNYSDIQAADLTAVFTIYFNDEDMYNSFKSVYEGNNSGWEFDDENHSATYIF
jgi:hypothetical protein